MYLARDYGVEPLPSVIVDNEGEYEVEALVFYHAHQEVQDLLVQ